MVDPQPPRMQFKDVLKGSVDLGTWKLALLVKAPVFKCQQIAFLESFGAIFWAKLTQKSRLSESKQDFKAEVNLHVLQALLDLFPPISIAVPPVPLPVGALTTWMRMSRFVGLLLFTSLCTLGTIVPPTFSSGAPIDWLEQQRLQSGFLYSCINYFISKTLQHLLLLWCFPSPLHSHAPYADLHGGWSVADLLMKF